MVVVVVWKRVRWCEREAHRERARRHENVNPQTFYYNGRLSSHVIRLVILVVVGCSKNQRNSLSACFVVFWLNCLCCYY